MEPFLDPDTAPQASLLPPASDSLLWGQAALPATIQALSQAMQLPLIGYNSWGVSCLVLRAWVSYLGSGHMLAKGARIQSFEMRGVEH